MAFIRQGLVSAILCAFVISTTQAVPGSYQLQKRDLQDLVERNAAPGNQPYAPDLYSRNNLEDDEVTLSYQKRDAFEFKQNQKRSLSSWTKRSFNEDSPSQMYFTSKGDFCQSDVQCSGTQFCDAFSSQCVDKLEEKMFCAGNHACLSGYCGRKGKCLSKKADSAKCYQSHDACQSGYCSIKQDICKPKAELNGNCVVSLGCVDGLSCVSGHCYAQTKSEHEAPTKRSLVERGHESGSAYNPRELTPTKRSPHGSNPSLNARLVQEDEQLEARSPKPSGSAHQPRELSPTKRGHSGSSPSGSAKYPRELEPTKRGHHGSSPSGSSYEPRELSPTKRGHHGSSPSLNARLVQVEQLEARSPSPSGHPYSKRELTLVN